MSDVNDQTQTEAEPEAKSPQQVDAILADFQAKMDAGEFGDRPFHNLMMEHLFPLLGDGSLEPEKFSALVRRWAGDHYPWDWQVRSFLDE